MAQLQLVIYQLTAQLIADAAKSSTKPTSTAASVLKTKAAVKQPPLNLNALQVLFPEAHTTVIHILHKLFIFF